MTYSGQKKRNFTRIFVICAADGRIIDVYAPFAATDNDADIAMAALRLFDQLKEILRKGDVIIVDRGFKDCVEPLKKQGYNIQLPTSKIF